MVGCKCVRWRINSQNLPTNLVRIMPLHNSAPAHNLQLCCQRSLTVPLERGRLAKELLAALSEAGVEEQCPALMLLLESERETSESHVPSAYHLPFNRLRNLMDSMGGPLFYRQEARRGPWEMAAC